jgi:hypothetical protein
MTTTAPAKRIPFGGIRVDAGLSIILCPVGKKEIRIKLIGASKGRVSVKQEGPGTNRFLS